MDDLRSVCAAARQIQVPKLAYYVKEPQSETKRVSQPVWVLAFVRARVLMLICVRAFGGGKKRTGADAGAVVRVGVGVGACMWVWVLVCMWTHHSNR